MVEWWDGGLVGSVEWWNAPDVTTITTVVVEPESSTASVPVEVDCVGVADVNDV